MVLGDDIAQLRLSLATEARIVLSNNLDRYVGRTGVGSAAQTSPSMCVNALIKALGCTLLVYREYAASESANHPFAGSLEQCIRILRDDVCPGVLSHECTGEGGSSLAHRVCLHLDRTTDELTAISPELLLNPQISGELHRKALCYLAEASRAWRFDNREHFDVPEAGESSSSYPSTLLSTEQATSVSTSAPASVCASSVLEEARISSPRSSRTPSGDIEPPSKQARRA
ncbi:hypothetical protein ANAPC1_01395 [Anaplasma phagocytophilum]|uniref:Uncharacterized protein n=3 Tax=Anaplasma phagocytophilum TaxID=948 RepID=A0AA45UUJ8_ANAPH|nr:hypothetical protein ANAPC1_01395 [Anaplasma phagocytophilum]